jgi:PAS domain S-box-containing protein
VSDKALRTLVERYLDGVLLVVDGRIHYANRVLREMTGYNAEEALGMPAAKFLAPADRERVLARIRELQAGGPEYPSQYQLLTKSGETVPVEVSSRFIEYEGKPSLLSMIRNISRRKRAEATLQVQLAAMDTASEGIGILDDGERYIYMNRAHAAIYGFDSPAELIGKTWRVLYEDREIDRIEREVFPLLERDGSWHGETPGRKRDGTFADVEISLTPLQGGGMICVCRDITERRRAESALRASEERYRALYEDNPSMYFTVDKNGVVMSVNRYGAEQLGYRVAELVDRPVLDVFYEEDRESAREHLAECLRNPDRSFDWEFRKVRFDGSIVWVREFARVVRDASGEPLVLIVCEDITQRKTAEDERRSLATQVQYAQKLESLGLMAGGIAHDFNNLLVGVLGNAGLALSRLPEGSPLRKDILAVEKAADRAADLCKQLLAYSGRGRFEVQAIDLSELVRDMGDLLNVAVAKKTTVRYDLTPDLPAIEGDAAQMRQIIMNLMTNARGQHENGTHPRGLRQPARGAIDARVLRLSRGHRLRPRDGRRDLLAYLRPLLHHQIYRARTRTGRGSRDRSRTQRSDRRPQRARARYDLSRSLPGHGPTGGCGRRDCETERRRAGVGFDPGDRRRGRRTDGCETSPGAGGIQRPDGRRWPGGRRVLHEEPG